MRGYQDNVARVRAARTLSLAEGVALGAGTLKKSDATALRTRLRRDIAAGRGAPPQDLATTMRAFTQMGVQVG